MAFFCYPCETWLIFKENLNKPVIWLYKILLLLQSLFNFSLLVSYCTPWLINREPMLCLYNYMEMIPRLSPGHWVLDIIFEGFLLNPIPQGNVTIELRLQAEICPSLAGVAGEGFLLDPCKLSGHTSTACRLTSSKGCRIAANCASAEVTNRTREWGRKECTWREKPRNIPTNSTSSQLRPKHSKTKETKGPLLKEMTDELGKVDESTITSAWEREEKFEMLKDWSKQRRWVGRRDERLEGLRVTSTLLMTMLRRWKRRSGRWLRLLTCFWMCGDATK